MKVLTKTLAATAVAVSAIGLTQAPAFAESKFACAAGRHLHHERDGLGPPLLGAGVRGLQAGRRGDGLRGGLLGHARLRHHQADRLLRAGPRQAAEGHPPAPDAGRSLHRADQPRHRKRRRDRHLRRRLAEVEARLLHHLGQPGRGQVRGRGDRRTARRQGRVCGAREPRPEQPRPPRHRLHRLHGARTIRT